MPLVLVAGGFRALSSDWYVRHQIAALPAERYGLSSDERARLAIAGLRSIEPGGSGLDVLRLTELPDGSPAFDAREIRHMADVRRLYVPLMHVHTASWSALLVALLVSLRVRRLRAGLARFLRMGALATLGVAVLLVPFILFGFDSFFTRFHEVLFPAGGWRFSETDTLRRVYPDRFWSGVATATAALVVAQTLILGLAGHLWLRRVRA